MSESSFGVGLSYGATPTSVGSIIDIKAAGFEKNTYEDKHLDQADRWIPKLGAFVDGKDVTITLSYNKTQFAALLAILDDEDPVDWTIEVPDGSTLEFPGLLKLMGLDFPEDGTRITSDVTVEVAGKPTFTPAT